MSDQPGKTRRQHRRHDEPRPARPIVAPQLIPARYAISQSFRSIQASADINGTDGHWMNIFRPDVLRRRLRVDALQQEIMHGATATSLTSFVRRDGRRLGRPQSIFHIGRLVADRFLMHDPVEGWTGEDQRVLVLRRETVHARSDHLEERSSPSGITISRHALERLYERERCGHEHIHRRILADLAEADQTLSFAVAAGLFTCGGPLERDACTMLPLGDGLLVVRNVTVCMKTGLSPATRYCVGKAGIVSHPVARDAARAISMSPLSGTAVDGHVMAMGMTYLSHEILRLEQSAYMTLFREEIAKVDLDEIAADAGRTWLQHERRRDTPAIEASPRLHYLLSQIAPPRAPGRACLSIGWTGSGDPRTTADQARHAKG
jgi:hypothetical protein